MKLAAPLLAALLLSFTPVLAQENPVPPANTPNHSEGTKPDNRGSTGWGGAAREPETTGSLSDSSAAAGQPLMATGVDLKGPPQRFPPNKTPE